MDVYIKDISNVLRIKDRILFSEESSIHDGVIEEVSPSKIYFKVFSAQIPESYFEKWVHVSHILERL